MVIQDNPALTSELPTIFLREFLDGQEFYYDVVLAFQRSPPVEFPTDGTPIVSVAPLDQMEPNVDKMTDEMSALK